MALFTIADLHLPLGCDKPMDVFPGWAGYLPKLEQAWRSMITPQDTVVLGGDISWAMKLEETQADFAFLQQLPGRKIILKGNHDYWWTTMAKMNDFLAANGFDSLSFLFNNSYEVDGVSLCGTRGWLFDDTAPHDAKVMARETGRLRMSLQAATTARRFVFLHYPPLCTNAVAPQMIEVMQEYGAERCYYGHLHGDAIRWAVQGKRDGIAYKLVSADALAFVPLKIEGV